MPDIFLLKLFGTSGYFVTLASILSVEFYILYRILKSRTVFLKNDNENTEKTI